MSIDQLPDETPDKPAPGELLLVQLFVSTHDPEDGSDSVADPARLGSWLSDHGLMEPGDEVSEGDVQRAQDVREALRALLLANNGGEEDPAARPLLNRAAERAGVLVHFPESGGCELVPQTGGVDGALGRLLSIVHRSMAEGTWPRFKACREHTCQYPFYDRSKNRSGAWCTMEVCGNRTKARAYRERQRPSRA